MPDDPNRNVGEQLAAWARKRRDEAGAPFELHSATRKMLQAEVARNLPKKSDKPAPEPAGWSKMFWPRFALAGGLCVVLVAVVGILLPGLAKSKSKAQHLASVRQQERADPGKIVVALVNGEATIKKLVKGQGYYVLKPESTNSKHRPIIVAQDFRVQGIVCRVFKKGGELVHVVEE